MKKLSKGDTVYIGVKKVPIKIAEIVEVNDMSIVSFLYCVGPEDKIYKVAVYKDGKIGRI